MDLRKNDQIVFSIEKIVLINFYKIIWNNLTKQFMIIETSKSQQIPLEVTYGENLVKDNSIAPSTKRRSKHT